MFRSARWRSEKNKVKVVFKLQFHATQVSQFSADALMVSLIPADVGKPTVKSDKAMVRNETCRWENPVYETVKFNREPRTGKISERIYYVHVSNGSSKAGSIGEVSIDFADYAEATKPSSASFPLKNPNSDAVLHVLIQRLHADADQREVEECEDAKIKSENRSLKTFLSHGDADEESVANDTTEDGPSNKTTHDADLNCNCRASIGSDVTLSSSESSSGLDTPRELGLRISNIHQDPSSFLSSVSHTSLPHEQAANASMTVYDEEWSGSSDHGISTDDSTHSSHNTLSRERSEQASDTEMEKLKAELVALARQADVSELELQTLRKQIVKESKRGQDLSREIANIKDERDALKSECEKLKDFHKRMDDAKVKNKLQSKGGDVRALAEEIRQELTYEKDLNANLRLQLQKTQESNSELILAVRDLDDMLEAKNREISDLSNKIGSCENAEELKVNLLKCETDDDEEQKGLKELVKELGDAKETYLLERKIIDLYGEIEIYRRDKDELEMQMEQLALDYEILKQENHDMSYKLEQSQLQEQLKIQYECSFPPTGITQLEAHIESLENELKKQSKEFSDSLATIRDLEMHITSLEEEMEKQAQGFEADLEAVTHAKVKQEQRAIQAEEALQKTRWRNASTAERLQEEFRRLSVQMASAFDANEKVAMKALKEANELRWQKSQLEEILQKVKQELQTVRDDYEARIRELSNQIDMNACQIEQMLVEIDNESKQLEYQKQHGEEVSRAFSEEIEMLKTEIRRLIAENICLSEQKEQQEICRAEFEHMKASIRESEMLVQRENVERNELVSTIALLKKEAEKSLEELSRIRHLKDEKEATVGLLQSEMETLKAQCADLKNSSFEDEVEKEKLRKQIFQLKNDLRKKDDAFTSIEKKLKDSNGCTVSDGAKNALKNNKSAPVPRGSKEVATLREKIKLLQGEIKLKETSLETSTNSFLKKQKDLQNKIEELENRVEELNQISSFQKVIIDTSGIISNSSVPEEATAAVDPMNSTACLPKENENTWSLVKSIDETSSEKEVIKDSSISKNDVNLDLIAELASLKEKNDSMESELNEMQERYSEISLKFAEVEGERQKLVMTVRNLKIAMKSY